MTATIRTIDGGYLRVCPLCRIHVYSAVACVLSPEFVAQYERLNLSLDACNDCFLGALMASERRKDEMTR